MADEYWHSCRVQVRSATLALGTLNQMMERIMTDIRTRSYGRWLGIPAVIVLVLVVSACHRHHFRHHHLGDGGYYQHTQPHIVAFR